jgi:acetyl esterase/lipase
MKHLSVFAVALLIFYITGSCQQYSKSWKDLDYAGDNMVYHRMDVYLPETVRPSYPAVIIIYGSAFLSNDAKQAAFKTLGKPLLKSGFAVIAVNHRSSRDSVFPAQINDIKAAVRFIQANGTSYQIDTAFIGVTGYSSGGHLSAFTGTSGSVRKFTVNSASADIEGKVGKFTAFSSSVDAVVDWFGPTAFQLMDSCGSQMTHNAADSPESLLIGGPIQENGDKCALADPITYVDAKDPPFLILHGDADPLVPFCQSRKLFEELQKHNVPSQFILVPKAGHGPGLFEERYFKVMTDFFVKESGKRIKSDKIQIK